MHIDHDTLDLRTEGDVEAKLLVPLIVSERYLNIPDVHLYSKEYLPPKDLDKGAKVVAGYFPDFSVWMHGFPVMLVEAKAPGVPVEQAYREAALYARHLNSGYPSGFNPCNFVLASNGERILFGKWDAAFQFEATPQSIRPGSAALERIINEYGGPALKLFALKCLNKVKAERGVRPFNRAGGDAIINSKKPLNSFAPELSPVLVRYFSSTQSTDVKEISERAYVSSEETTEYDRILEALLKDRVSLKRDTIVERLEPSRHTEANVAKAISSFDQSRPPEGRLQIIQGAVGSGKSLFIRRYKELLQPDLLRERSRWAWVDFNPGPADLSSAQLWLAEAFLESFARENPELDLSSKDVLKGIFARQIQRRKGIYDDVRDWSPEKAAILRNEDLMKWQDDHLEHMRGLANYVLGQRQEVLIVVMDNVDRLDLKGQLDAFHLALWFMEQTRSFVILQMRDETYERFKNRPPLDAFRSGIAFHISPPRFTDVVKKRLELSIEYLAATAGSRQTYTLPSGHRITLPMSELGRFLQELYVELFERRRNISRILESLAGRDVRRALQMFVSIITSGHLREDQITSQVRGAGEVTITEHNILKILMRTEYRFFSDQSGVVSNIFNVLSDWKKPSNFMISDLLFFLARARKEVGQIGIEGYFSVRNVSDLLQLDGYDPDDLHSALNYLLQRGLVIADHMNNVRVDWDDCVKISASGYIHLRTLADRVEYLYGVLPSTPILDEGTANFLADFVKRESRFGEVSILAKLQAVEGFYGYLLAQAKQNASAAGLKFDVWDQSSGTAYVLKRIAGGLTRYRSKGSIPREDDAGAIDEGI